MIPKHENPTRKERTATAPYNFVPLPDRVIAFPDRPNSAARVDQGTYHSEDRYTGWIDVDLETLSPIYVRGGLAPDRYEVMERQEKDTNDKTPHLQKERNRPDFFNTVDPNSPVIPGSSLRGMLRTMCEIIGHGKLSPVSDQALVYRAVGDTSSHGEAYRKELMNEVPGQRNYFEPKFEGGYIREEDDGWYIQPAERLNPSDPDSPTHARIRINDIPSHGLKHWRAGRQAFEIYVACDNFDFKKVRGGFVHIKRVNVTRASASSEPGLRPAVAVLARTGPVPRKATEAILFTPAAVSKNQWIRIPDGTDPDDRRDLVAEYLDQVTKTGKHNQKELLGSDQGVLRDGHPVMYVMEGEKLRFFGHTQMFRMPYRFSPRDLLPDGHKDVGKVDLAELMFGAARSQTGGAAGRVFVEDARLVAGQGNVWLQENPVVIPKILGGPKPTTFQHYLTQPKPDVDRGKGLKTYNDRGETTLRGHKLYWHRGSATRDTFAERPMNEEARRDDTQHTQIKPVRAGVRFRFRIRFENLLAEELGLLWRSVELPGNNYAHKLGMGKPLGLGSVRLSPTLTLINPQARYETLLDLDEAGNAALAAGRESDAECANVERGAVELFEKLAIKALQLPDGTRLDDTPRMRNLLELLRWPGPPPAKTRYMNIGIDEETNKITGENEFKERKVLPDPIGVTRS